MTKNPAWPWLRGARRSSAALAVALDALAAIGRGSQTGSTSDANTSLEVDAINSEKAGAISRFPAPCACPGYQ
jgi:hypothetical protein